MLQNDSASKAIIFSQFTSMLDLIGYALEQVFSSYTVIRSSSVLYLFGLERLIRFIIFIPDFLYRERLKIERLLMIRTAFPHMQSKYVA